MACLFANAFAPATRPRPPTATTPMIDYVALPSNDFSGVAIRIFYYLQHDVIRTAPGLGPIHFRGHARNGEPIIRSRGDDDATFAKHGQEL